MVACSSVILSIIMKNFFTWLNDLEWACVVHLYRVWVVINLRTAEKFFLLNSSKFDDRLLSLKIDYIWDVYDILVAIYHNFLSSNKFHLNVFRPLWGVLFEAPTFLVGYVLGVSKYSLLLCAYSWELQLRNTFAIFPYCVYLFVWVYAVLVLFLAIPTMLLIFTVLFKVVFFLLNFVIIHWFHRYFYKISPVFRDFFWEEGLPDNAHPSSIIESPWRHTQFQAYKTRLFLDSVVKYYTKTRDFLNLQELSDFSLKDNFIFILPEIIVFFSTFYFLIRALGLLELTKYKQEYILFLLKLWRNIEILVYFLTTLTFAELLSIRVHELTLRFSYKTKITSDIDVISITDQSTSNKWSLFSFITGKSVNKKVSPRKTTLQITWAEHNSPLTDFTAQVQTCKSPASKASLLYSPAFDQFRLPAYRLKDLYRTRVSYYNPSIIPISNYNSSASPRTCFYYRFRTPNIDEIIKQTSEAPRPFLDPSDYHYADLPMPGRKNYVSYKMPSSLEDYWDWCSFSVGSFSEFFDKILTDPPSFRSKLLGRHDPLSKRYHRYIVRHLGRFASKDDMHYWISWYLPRFVAGLSFEFNRKYWAHTQNLLGEAAKRDRHHYYTTTPCRQDFSVLVNEPYFLDNVKTYINTFDTVISAPENSGYKYAPVRTSNELLYGLKNANSPEFLKDEQLAASLKNLRTSVNNVIINEPYKLNPWVRNRTQPYSLDFGFSHKYQFFLFDNLLIHDIFYLGTKLFFLLLFLIFIKLLRVTVTSALIVPPEQPFLVASLLLFFLVSLMSIDLNLLYVCFEAITIIIVVLIAQGYSEFSVDAAVKYFSLNAITSGLLIFGTSIFYGYTLSTEFLNISDFFFSYSVINLGYDLTPIIFALTLIVISFFLKLGVWPGSLWVFDVYAGCSVVTLFLISVVLKVVVFFIFIRLLLFGFFYLFFYWKLILLLSATGSLLFSSLGLTLETRLNSFIAYSSIGQFGFMLLGFTCYPSVQSLSFILLYLISYCTAICGIFMLLPMIFGRLYDNENISKLINLYRKNLFLASILTILLASLAGLPPFLGFFVKYRILMILTSSACSFSLLLLVLFSTTLTTYGYFRLIAFIWFDNLKMNTGGLNSFSTVQGYITYKSEFKRNGIDWSLRENKPHIIKIPAAIRCWVDYPEFVRLRATDGWFINLFHTSTYLFKNKWLYKNDRDILNFIEPLRIGSLVKKYGLFSFFIFFIFMLLHIFGFFTIWIISNITEYYAFHFFYPNLVDSWTWRPLRTRTPYYKHDFGLSTDLPQPDTGGNVSYPAIIQHEVARPYRNMFLDQQQGLDVSWTNRVYRPWFEKDEQISFTNRTVGRFFSFLHDDNK